MSGAQFQSNLVASASPAAAGTSTGVRYLSSATSTTTTQLFSQYVTKALTMYNNAGTVSLYANLPYGNGGPSQCFGLLGTLPLTATVSTTTFASSLSTYADGNPW
jgi:hypothetical protein